ncbi:MAG: right-handed parallel beta-helix repeat-containing protein, partial [Clostridia bacterium]|nr:right-handed parallel beta-helix repeat-containing protein [Clostridia bacterium]
EASNSKNLYVCDNSLGGRLTVNNNNFFLCDGNTFPEDEWTHDTVQTGNMNHNGNNLMDVNARLEVGADENLLPHIDKDLFVGMDRKTFVKDVTESEDDISVTAYILAHCKTDDYVIVAPGAYAAESGMSFRAEHSNTTIYAYGVYVERQVGLGQMMNFYYAEDITIKGMTIGFKQQSCGQVYVLEKLGEDGRSGKLRVVTGAGMMNEFGNTNTKYYDVTGMGAQRMGTFYAYCDTGFWSIQKDNTTEAVPTMIMETSASVYAMLAVGDVLTCRANNGTTTIGIHTECKNLVFYDFNIYGNASGFAYVEQDARTATTYYRVCDTTRSGEIIEEDLYNQYKALEVKYGVTLEVERDDLGRYRGSPAHIGSIDATHTTRCGEGSQATFCLFENMCDDATNQNATHGRLDEIIVNEAENTVTIIYKGNFSEYSCSYNKWQPVAKPGGFCYNFKEGDRVYVYTSKGQLICDTPALSATQNVDTVNFLWKDHGFKNSTAKGSVDRRSVTVSLDGFNVEALEDFDLKDNHWRSDNKVLIDNMSMSSNGFKFDNCKFQNIRSRGLLIKASGGTIQNCTFRNIGMSCGAILYEIYWGESGVTENMLVDRNLFDHTGYFKNQDRYATVAIEGLGSSVEEDFLLYKNITISNNHIMRRTIDYAIYINSAKNVKVLNNTFGPFVGNDFTDHPEEPDTYESPRPVIHINGGMDIEISGNTYPNPDYLGMDYVVAERNKHVYGTDVTMDGTVDGDPLIPDMVE